MRVLICEDDRDLADATKDLLALDRHEIVVCYDGHHCIETARSFAPDVAILDIDIPTFNGYSVAAAIRSMEFGERTLLIAVTAYGMQEDVHLATKAGFDLHMTKPADAERLLGLVACAARH